MCEIKKEINRERERERKRERERGGERERERERETYTLDLCLEGFEFVVNADKVNTTLIHLGEIKSLGGNRVLQTN